MCVLSGVLAAGMLVLWAATRTTPGGFVAERARGYALGSHDGRVYASVATLMSTDAAGDEVEAPLSPEWRVRTESGLPLDFLTRLALADGAGRSFGIARDVHGVVIPVAGQSFATDFSWSRRRTSAVMFPHWLAASIFAALPAAWAGRRAARAMLTSRRRLQGRCTTCGYDLRGTPGTCPECGVARAT